MVTMGYNGKRLAAARGHHSLFQMKPTIFLKSQRRLFAAKGRGPYSLVARGHKVFIATHPRV